MFLTAPIRAQRRAAAGAAASTVRRDAAPQESTTAAVLREPASQSRGGPARRTNASPSAPRGSSPRHAYPLRETMMHRRTARELIDTAAKGEAAGPGFKRTPDRGVSALKEAIAAERAHKKSESLTVTADLPTARFGPSGKELLEEGLHDGPEESDIMYGGVEGLEVDGDTTPALEPGTFIELRRQQKVTYGVTLTMSTNFFKLHVGYASFISPDNLSLAVLSNGEIWVGKKSDVVFALPNFVSAEAATLATPHQFYSNDGEVALSRDSEVFDPVRFAARGNIVKAMRKLIAQSEIEMGRLSPRFTELFLANEASISSGDVKAEVEDVWGTITTEQAARLLLASKKGKGNADVVDEPLAPETLLAVHTLLMNHPMHFVADPGQHRVTSLFTIRPPSHRANLDHVVKWVHENDPCYTNFLIKAREMAAWRQQARAAALRKQGAAADSPVDFVAPQEISADVVQDLPPQPRWNKTDLEILRFIRLSLRDRRTTQEHMYKSVVPSIVKQAGLSSSSIHSITSLEDDSHGRSHLVGGYERLPAGDIVRVHTISFLKEVGFFPPWFNLVEINSTFEMVTEAQVVPYANESGALPTPKEATVKASGAVSSSLLNRDGFYADDPLASVRHDFGNLPVYVIDDTDAVELDDGVSIEPLPSGKEWWIHVHIADPTSVLPPNHPVSLRAQQQFSSFYFTEKQIPMLPHDFTFGMGVDLGSGSRGLTDGARAGQKGHARNVLTFSAKVDERGEILDYCVRAGLVHNVRVIDYDSVDQILIGGGVTVPAPWNLPKRNDQPLPMPDSSARTDLQQLYDLSRVLFKWRFGQGMFFPALPVPSVTVSIAGLPQAPRSEFSSTPTFFVGFPEVHMKLGDFHTISPARNAVAEFAVFAGRVATAFSREHKLVVPFRGQPGLSGANMEEVLALRDAFTGTVDYLDLIKRKTFMQASAVSTKPVPHAMLGLQNGYVRMTSPLRRYGDMLSHWQVKSVLAPPSSPLHGRPPLDNAGLEALVPHMDRLERYVRRAQDDVDHFWAASDVRRRLLHARHTGQRAEGLEELTAVPLSNEIRLDPSTMAGRVKVVIKELGLRAFMEWGPREAVPDVKTVYKVTISHVVLDTVSTIVVKRL